MKFCSFDIETATVTPENSDPHQYRPLGICCAATQLFEVDEHGIVQHRNPVRVWHAYEKCDGMYAHHMGVSDVMELADYLAGMADEGYFPLGWNSLGFDFDILAEECFDPDYGRRLAHLALMHFDPAFQMLCEKGYMIGMQAAALGLGLPGKLAGMHGDLAPVLWAKSPADQATVLDYVSQDVVTTTDILIQSTKQGRITWISKAGRPQSYAFKIWLPVEECIDLPEVDTSWMSQPRTRQSCYNWTQKYLREAAYG